MNEDNYVFLSGCGGLVVTLRPHEVTVVGGSAMDVTELKIIETWFAKHQGAWVDVVLAGRIFGGRYGESPQMLRKCTCEGETLHIEFETTEVLTVERPAGFMLGKDDSLIIRKAEHATFGWHYYGRSQKPENWCEEHYRLVGDIVHLQRTGPLLPVEEEFSLSRRHFVELSVG